ncbi:TetR/AcrR family transcriptional regulator C-terminal domain-containing protein [Plantibacter sp. RU18]|uniref:TetR/AcrR family transcriptional regulator C-terminal domain-containing protein n=1 Tax=Plantibacter sp. RU18 TaxID=3158143 RepID=UPI003D35AB42
MDPVALNDTPRGRGRPRVAREHIIETALEILDEGGAEALTLRSLATRLSSSTATLYRHVANRNELIGMILDHVLGEVELPDSISAELSWEDACRSIATSSYRALSARRDAARLLTEAILTGPNVMRIRESMLAALLREGFDPVTAAKAAAAISHFALGFALQTATTAAEADAGRTQLSELLHSDGGRRFPATAAVAEHLPRPLDEEFAFGLDLILRGLEKSR